MKRKLLLLTFLSFYCLGFSQSELYVLLKKPVNNTPSGNDCRIGDYRSSYYISHYQDKYEINSNSINVTVDYRQGYNDDPSYGCGGPCGHYSEYCDGVEFGKEFIHFDSFYNKYVGADPIECISNCFPISYSVVLLPKITTPADRRCERDNLFKQYSDGQDHNVTGLIWEYYSTTGWKEIPSYKNRYPLNVSLLDVFGNSWRSKFNGNLQLRFKFTAPFTNEVVYSIQKYTITLTECSPDFESYYNLSNTSCSYKSDGKIGVKLSNNINSTEQLVATLFKKDSNGDILINQYSTKQLDSTDPTVLVFENLGGVFFGFNWPVYIDAGTYYFRYQVLSKATTPSKPKATDPFWYTLVKTPNFTIQKATNVTFEAVRFSDENCFKSGDGKIRIYNVSGGTGEGYEYELNESYNWIPFNPSNKNVKEVVIGGLGKGTYKIKIRDSKKCMAKE
ncbi:hypothetical protein C7448_11121 [Tenacibaculum gallaicum]|uniref:Uncharacterized protein n=1 Tax=Tenacibaculum gallaicum TaxID=561505 RepID=A0A3E0HFJ3_9FLAO|nr:hypothetical protein [Tenacibaculum gallaicum]REH44489.1 hypothetical protein C7448_11121 [Tenacibaculum gallaicum]